MAFYHKAGRPPEQCLDSLGFGQAVRHGFFGLKWFLLFSVFAFEVPLFKPSLAGNVTTETTPISGKDYRDPGNSLLYACPKETRLFKNQCYWVVQYRITWSQANETCQSQGGHLARISSESEQEWVSHLLGTEIASNATAWIVPSGELDVANLIFPISSDTLFSAASLEFEFTCFIQLTDSTYVWSNGQFAQQQDGFWATDGLTILETFPTPPDQPAPLCGYLGHQSASDTRSPYSSHEELYPPTSGPGLRWYLGTCEERRASVCQHQACELHAIRCTDGSRCVPSSRVCDVVTDCQDGSDEDSCGWLESDNQTQDSSQQCNFNFKTANGSFQFPQSSQEYLPFSRCVWTIATEPLNFIKITITDLDIETGYDFLSVYKGRQSSESLIQTFTGTQDFPKTVTIPTWLATVVFRADATIGGKGVNLVWETVPVDGSACGGQLVAGNGEARLNPTVTQLTGHTNCEWLISTNGTDQLISFLFVSLELKPANKLTVYDGPNRTSPVITLIDGHNVAMTTGFDNTTQTPHGATVNIPPVILSSGPQLYITLSTRAGSLGEFVAKYTQGCDINVPSKNQTVFLLSPGYGQSRYPATMDCSWTVYGSGTGHGKVLFLPGFYTESGQDFITVYHGLEPLKDSLLNTFSGEIQPTHSDLVSPSGHFHITFHTDATVNQGKWAALISQGCEPIVASQNLQIDLQDSSLGGVVRFSCEKGFYLSGPANKTCWIGRQWVPPEDPVCKAISCGAVPVPEGSYLVNVTGSHYGDTATYSCDVGYTLVNSDTARCTAQGWQDVPRCQAITCPKQRPPRHGSAWAASTVYGTLREYFCTAPTRLIGSAFSHCTDTGQWTDDVPVCEYPHCPALPNPQHGTLSPSGRVKVNDSTTVICEAGYQLRGPSELNCQQNETYDKPLSSCKDNDECHTSNPCEPHKCLNLPGSYACSCGEGYTHESGSLQTCVDINECDVDFPCSHICKNLDGTFMCGCPPEFHLYSGPTYTTRDGEVLQANRTCIQTCPPIAHNSVSRIIYDKEPLYHDGSFPVGTSAKVVCPYRYHVKNSTSSRCTSSGQWSHLDVNCIESQCTPPEVSVPHLQVSYTSLALYSVAQLSCDPGFILVGNSKLFCLTDSGKTETGAPAFTWRGSLPSCTTIRCPSLAAPVAGQVSVEGTGYQDAAVYTCSCGHRLVGHSVVTCTIDGTWSAPAPTCEPISCDPPVIPNCGNLSFATPGFPLGSQIEFQCPRLGFVLSDRNPLTCQALDHSKVSELLPLVNIYLTVDLNFKSLGVRRNCLGKFQKKIRKALELWLAQTALCSGSNVKTFVQVKPGLLDKQPSLEFTISIRVQSEEVLCACSEAVDQRLKRLDMTSLLQQHRAGYNPCTNLVDVVSAKPLKQTGWTCPLGLRLDAAGFPCQPGKRPACMEDCVMHPTTSSAYNRVTPPIPTNHRATVQPESDSMTDWPIVQRRELDATKRDPDIKTLTFENSSDLNETFHDIHMPMISDSTFGTQKNSTNHIILQKETIENPSSQLSESNVIEKMPENHILTLDNSSNVNHTFQELDNEAMTIYDTQNSSTPFTELLSSSSTGSTTSGPWESTSGDPKTNSLDDLSSAFSLRNTTPNSLSWNTSPQYSNTWQMTTPSLHDHSSVTNDQATSEKPQYDAHYFDTTTALPTDSNREFETVTVPGRLHISFEHVGKRGQPLELETENNFLRRKTSDSLWRETPDGRFERVSSEAHFSQLGVSSEKFELFNCSNPLGAGNQQNSGGEGNGSDCMTTQPLEKDKVTMVQSPRLPLPDLRSPVFTIETRDVMSGDFLNISCIDAVHISINSKVNELLREFTTQMGRAVCEEARDSTLQLASGNIRFKGSKADIYIQFSISYNGSNRAPIEACSEDFRSYASSQLPKKFRRVKREIPQRACSFVQYSGQDFIISNSGWSCHNGYALDLLSFQCQASHVDTSIASLTAANFTTTVSSKRTPVLTVPRLTLTFSGVFSPAYFGELVNDSAIEESRAALSLLLSRFEGSIQGRYFQCKDIFIDISNGVNLTRRSRNKSSLQSTQLNAQAECTLIALNESVSKQALTKCAGFLSLEYREPLQHLPTVTLAQPYLPRWCPPIVLYPPELRADLNAQQFICQQGYNYHTRRFRCIEDSLPMYVTGLKISLNGRIPKGYCEGVFKLATAQFVKRVSTMIQTKINNDELCKSTMNDVVVLEEEQPLQNVIYDQFQAIVILPVALVSLSGQTEACVSCMREIYTHLTTLVRPFSRLLPGDSQRARPFSRLLRGDSHNCLNLVTTRGGITVLYKNWNCRGGLLYDASSHRCHDRLEEGLPEKGPRLSRHRRETKTGPGVAWSAKTPQCVDVEPPVILGCPRDAVFVTVGSSVESHGFRPPIVTDNNPQAPTVSFSPQQFNFTSYVFRSLGEFPVTMVAKDANGNRAGCSFTFIVQNSSFPNLQCPKKLVTIYSNNGKLIFPPNFLFSKYIIVLFNTPQDPNSNSFYSFNITDQLWQSFNGSQSESLFIPFIIRSDFDNDNKTHVQEGSSIYPKISPNSTLPTYVRYYISSMSSLPLDTVGKAAALTADTEVRVLQSCEFFVIVKRTPLSCDETRLAKHGALVTCVDVENALSCSVSCLFGGRFVTLPPPQYLCIEGDTWVPNEPVPKCGKSYPTDYVLLLVVGLRYQGDSTTHACLEEIEEAVSRDVRRRMEKSCDWALTRGDVRLGAISDRDIFTSNTPFRVMSTKLKIKINMVHHQDGNQIESAAWCAQQLRRDLNFMNATLGVSCGRCSLDVSVDRQLNQTCPRGMALVGDNTVSGGHTKLSCVECPPGMYEVKGVCVDCPIGTFMPRARSAHCQPCPQGLLTAHPGASSSHQCRAKCQMNHYSPTGLEPCIACPLWTKQEVPGSTACEELTLEESTDSSCDTPVDYCQFSPCMNGLCRNVYGDFFCDCFQSFTGQRCETMIGDTCSPNPCKNNGNCRIDSGPQGYQCDCRPGYYGSNCALSHMDCNNHDCFQGGRFDNTTCKCSCPSGFQGEHCEIEIDACFNVTCRNGGACEKSSNGFVCVCQTGYSGLYCDQVDKRCDTKFDLCFHGGVCTDNHTAFGGYSCICPQEYHGAMCETKVDYCAFQPCHPAGTLECQNMEQGHMCVCLPGRTGALCEVNMDPCASQPCLNGQVCLDGDHTTGQAYKCDCPAGFEGPDCLTPSDKCISNPCSNKAICVTNATDFSCQCRPGFSGNKCEINIDECASSPCLHGATCVDGVNFFTCRCPPGYRGRVCEISIMACLSQPCMNRATCTDLSDGGFLCTCNTGYTGEICESTANPCDGVICFNGGRCVSAAPEDRNTSPSSKATTSTDDIQLFHCECPSPFTGDFCNNTQPSSEDCLSDSTLRCQNGGVCRMLLPQEQEICDCTPYFYGPDCAKAKSPNFDLVFTGADADQWYSWDVEGSQEKITLCLWVKFLDTGSSASYLTLTVEDGSTIALTGQAVTCSSPAMTKPLPTSDGLWHQVCLLMSHHSVTVFTDGELSTHLAVAHRLKAGQRISLGLGSKDEDGDNSERFRGYIHGLNVYSVAISVVDIQQMSNSCSLDGGEVFSWATLDSFVAKSLRIREPSTCADNQCLDSTNTAECGTNKDRTEGTDRVAPVVAKCPATQMVTDDQSPTLVTWEEPEFSDNVGVTEITQSLRSGVALPYGEYFITYIAYDAANNSAICSFHLYVRKFNCTDPAPPSNGARLCGEWSHGRYCIPSCKANYQMVTPTPPFYRCGMEGTWDPGKLDLLVFPVCARVRPPANSIYGGVQFLSTGECDANVEGMLKARISLVLSHLEDILDLCETGGDNCHYKSELSVECAAVDRGQSNGLRRKRRDVTTDFRSNVYTVRIDVNLTASVTATTAEDLREGLEGRIKRVQDDVSLDLSELELNVSPRCVPGQSFVPGKTGVCMECPEGHFSSQVDGQRVMCKPCPIGEFNDKNAQARCQQCPQNLTTLKEGSSSMLDCIESCEKGFHYNTETGHCKACPLGQYQDIRGQTACKQCPPGLSTRIAGANHSSLCQALCHRGQELWLKGQCRPCPRGTYKSQDHLFCQPCPHGKITDVEGAVSLDMCSIDQCKRGHFWDRETGSCHPCPLGTFQPDKGQLTCESCESGYTTDKPGADSLSLCIAAAVDKCDLSLDSCSGPTVCKDKQDGYECVCQFGQNDNGQCIESCEEFCNTHQTCSRESKTDDRGTNSKDMWTQLQCDCPTRSCSNKPGEGTGEYQLLVVVCILVSSLALAVIFVTFTVVSYRKLKSYKQEPEVRYYRRSTHRDKRFTSTRSELARERRDYRENIYSIARSVGDFSINSSMRSQAALVLDTEDDQQQQSQQQQLLLQQKQQQRQEQQEQHNGEHHYFHRNGRQQQQQKSGQNLKNHQKGQRGVEMTCQHDREVYTVSMPLVTVWHRGTLGSTSLSSITTPTQGELKTETTYL